jgi:hypothetical protein
MTGEPRPSPAPAALFVRRRSLDTRAAAQPAAVNPGRAATNGAAEAASTKPVVQARCVGGDWPPGDQAGGCWHGQPNGPTVTMLRLDVGGLDLGRTWSAPSITPEQSLTEGGEVCHRAQEPPSVGRYVGRPALLTSKRAGGGTVETSRL